METSDTELDPEKILVEMEQQIIGFFGPLTFNSFVETIVGDLNEQTILELQENLQVPYPAIYFSKDTKYGMPITRPKLSPDTPCTDLSAFPERVKDAYYDLEIRASSQCSQSS